MAAKKIINFQLEQALLDRLKAIAAENRVSVSWVVRDSILEYLVLLDRRAHELRDQKAAVDLFEKAAKKRPILAEKVPE